MATFEGYERRKGVWFYLMLTIGEIISENQGLSASKTTSIANEFQASDFYRWMFADDKPIKWMKVLR